MMVTCVCVCVCVYIYIYINPTTYLVIVNSFQVHLSFGSYFKKYRKKIRINLLGYYYLKISSTLPMTVDRKFLNQLEDSGWGMLTIVVGQSSPSSSESLPNQIIQASKIN